MRIRRRPRVGVYVDAFNLYYGARDLCGRGTQGWRWLDIYGLVGSVIVHRRWKGARIVKMVYCTAMRSSESDASSLIDQETYVRALQNDRRTEVIHGRYAQRIGKGILVRPTKNRRRPERVISPGISNFPAWLPATEVQDEQGRQQVMIHYVSYEEKGSDVNLASQLIVDVLTHKIDAAIVISNDGDLRYAVEFARQKIMVGLINPGQRPTADALKGTESEGTGGHWWRRLVASEYRLHQLPDTVADTVRPPKW